MSFPEAAAGPGTPDAAQWRFNPPPGWPVPPQGWQPPEGWQPDPAWPPAPAGWDFWLPAQAAAGLGAGAGSAAVPGSPAGEVRLSHAGQSLTVAPGQQARIGRATDNDIVVSDPSVSRQHAVLRTGPDGWELVKVGSAPSFLDGREVSQVTVDRPLELALGSLDGPVLRAEPVPDRTVKAAAGEWSAGGPSRSGTVRLGNGPGKPGPGQPGPASPGPYAPPGKHAAAAAGPYGGEQPGWSGADPGWGWPQPASASNDFELSAALRILFPVQSWVHNSGWRQGLRLGVIIYALLPLIFLTVLSTSSSLSAPGWAYSLYIAPLWAIGFWMLIRPPGHLRKLELIIAAGIVVWTLIWINLITVNINDALPTKNGIGIGSAIVIGINEEVTKALPVLLAGLILHKSRGVKLDVRMWMFLGTIAGLTFGVAEQAFYTSNAIVAINQTASASQAVSAILEFAERVFVDGFQHAVWAGISGFFIGLGLNYRRRRLQLILIGIGTPAVLHALNDFVAGISSWLVIIVQAASLLLFLGYTMSAAQIEQTVRETPAFRGQSMIMEAVRFPDSAPPR